MTRELIILFTAIFIFPLIACSHSLAQNASQGGGGEAGNGTKFNSSMEKFFIWAEKQKEKKKQICTKNQNELSCFGDSNGDGLGALPNKSNVQINERMWVVPYGSKPNFETLLYYLYRYTESHQTHDPYTYQWLKYEVQPSDKKMEIIRQTYQIAVVKDQMQKTGILSYLFFDGGKLVVDEISPAKKFGGYITSNTKFRSNSVGKSLVAYLLGHAICEGFIESEEALLDDWELIKDTLYDGQKLIDILNMTSGDQKFVYDSNFLIDGAANRASSTEIETKNITQLMKKIGNSSPAKDRIYNYNVLNTHLILNYVLFKTDNKFESFLRKIFAEQIGIENSVYFYKQKHGDRANGNISNMFFASRYDYLRIAIKILNDWQSGNCVGNYLKRIYAKRIPKNLMGQKDRVEPEFNRTNAYGGQFHFEYPGLEEKPVIGMGGYGGQAILIDPENSRIVIVHSLHFNDAEFKYDHTSLLIDPIKKGFDGIHHNSERTNAVYAPTFVENSWSVDELPKNHKITNKLEKRFQCLSEFAAKESISDLPSKQEIETLVTRLEGYDFIKESSVTTNTDTNIFHIFVGENGNTKRENKETKIF